MIRRHPADFSEGFLRDLEEKQLDTKVSVIGLVLEKQVKVILLR